MAPVGTVRGRFELDAPALRTLRDLERQGIRTQAQMKALGDEMDRVADRGDRQRIEEYRKEMRRIGRDTAKGLIEAESAWAVSTKRINRHIDSQIAHVELLHQRIRALGRENATANIGVRGGTGAAAATSAARTALGTGTGSGANRVGGSGFRGVNIGGVSLGRGVLLGALGGVALPGLSALTGGGGALIGSAGLGALGAGAVGVTGVAGLAGGIGSIAAVAKPAASGIEEAAKAQQKFNEAVRDFGRTATQTRTARREYAQALAAAPLGTRRLLGRTRGFRRDFRRATRPAQGQFTGFLADQVGFGRELIPDVASASLVSTLALRRAGGDFGRFVTGGFGARALGTGSAIFSENLPAVEGTLENVLRTFVNLARAARPFFRDATEWVEDWTDGWARGTSDIRATREEIGDMVDHLRAWVRLGGSATRLLGDLLSAGAPEGRSTVERLTVTLNEWDRWVERHPAQVRDFFRRSTRAAEDFAAALWQIVRAVGRLSDDLLPVLSHFSTLVSGASALGLLTPGAGALLYGGFRGARGAGRPGGARGAGGPSLLALGAGGAGFAAARGAVGAAGARVAASGRAGALRFGPEFRPGAPQLVGQRAFGLGRLGPLGAAGRAGLIGAGRAFLPVGLGLGALTAAGFQGNVGERALAALSTLSLGVIRPPLTAAEQQDEVMRRADEVLSRLPGGAGGRAQRARIRRLRGLVGGGGDAFASLSTSGFLGIGGGGPDAGQIAAGNEALREALRGQIAVFREYRRQVRNLRLDRVTRDLGEAFGVFRRQRGPGRAIAELQRSIFPAMRQVGRSGDKALAQNAVDWARTAARGNPRLLRQVRVLERGIVERFRAMGRRIAIINGEVYSGSERAWTRIADVLTTRAERARQEVTESFTAIQRQALGTLRAMGFSASEARSLVRLEERGGGARQSARSIAGARSRGETIDPRVLSRLQAKGGGNARGGRIWGAGLGDNVRLATGQRAAPGELIVSRHTEAEVDAELARYGRPSLGSRVGRGRPHGYMAPGASKRRVGGHTSPPGFAVGGRIVPIPWQPGERTSSAVLGLITRLHRAFGTNVSDSYGPGHQSPGHTVYGTAVDWIPGTTGWDGVDRLVAWAVRHGYKTLYDGRFGSTAWPDHGRGNHAHIEFGSGGSRGGIPAGGLPGFGHINLRAPRSRLGGAPGAISTRAGQLYAGGLERVLNRRLGRLGGGLGGGFSGGGSAAANQRVARAMMRAMGWGGDQWPSLRELWTRESGWSQTARNPSSGAYGIPQALPASKMGPTAQGAGAEAARAQIAWGLRYIRGRYGSPAAALAFHNAHNWYARGGRVPAFRNGGSFVTGPGRGGLFMAGDNPYRREQVKITPLRPRRRPALSGLGGGLGSVTVPINFHGPIYARDEKDVERLARRVADLAGKQVLDAIRGEVSDAEIGV